ncbi:MAG: glycosyltransferase family 4 protein [Pseudomonadota bacterium]
MKILYQHRTKSADGQYVHIRELTEALKGLGVEIEMVSPDEAGGAARKNLDAGEGGGLSLKGRLPKPLYELAELAYSLPSFLKLRRAFAAQHPDVLYERYNLLFLAGVWLKKLSGVPMILEVNAPLFEERDRNDGIALKALARWSERAAWRAADFVLPVTDVLADMVRAAGVPDEKIVVVPNGAGPEFLAEVDPAPIREKYGLGDATVLGFTGFVRPWHGVDRVIRWMAGSGGADVRLLMVGDGPARSDLEALAAELGVAERVVFTGVVQREEVPGYVAAFDVALQPHVVAYASPLKLFEYMALGKAVIAPASPNIKEVLTDGETALLFPPEKPQAMAPLLDKLCAEETLRQRLGAAARRWIIDTDRTWAGNARTVMRLCEDLKSRT